MEELKKHALELMGKGGYPIKEDILLEADPKLPFMGYTTARNGKTVIVVAGWSLKTDMALGLIIHELSHVYRIETNHPSHNGSIHDFIVQKVLGTNMLLKYQADSLHAIINNLQDLYADDISFRVYIKEFKKVDLSDFFLGWIHTPITPPLTMQDKWKNAEMILSAAFAQANLQRHGVEDTNKKVATAINNFLHHFDKETAKKFIFFKNLMRDMPEKITEKAFETLLEKYIKGFLEHI